MSVDWGARHRAAGLIAEHYPDRMRLAVLAGTVGAELPAARGFEPLFATVSQLVLGLGDKLPELLRAAAAQHEAFAAWAPAPELAPDPEEEARTILAETVEEAPEGTAPRPAGTPAQAPPLDGVETWVARHIEWDLPENLAAGEGSKLVLRFRSPDGEAVGGAPAGHMAHVGQAFPVELELTVVGGRADESKATMRCDPIDKGAEEAFVVTPDADATELDIVLRCYSGGFEVGRGRLTTAVPNGERSSGGALAVPDTVLEQINEDVIKTVQGD